MGCRSWFALVAAATFLVGACAAKPQVAPEPTKKVAKKASVKKLDVKKLAAELEAAQRAALEESQKFTVPFAWEAEKDEPLALTRSFLREALSDNQEYMQHGEKFFAAFAEKQTPRATIITCADSRVHAQAWDATPENDDFTIRNIGNQLENAEGSIEYGVEHLNTPLLLVIGHTGCGAVKAAMDDMSKLSEPIRKELEHLTVPAPVPGKTPELAWAEAVIANVNNQVSFGLQHFSHDVHEGKLTIVGAVYDFRNDLQQGAGRLVIVNVNGNSNPERMASFVEAVNGREKELKEPPQKKTKKTSEHEKSPAETFAELSKIRSLSVRAVVTNGDHVEH
jgi:carbonic anhydrase